MSMEVKWKQVEAGESRSRSGSKWKLVEVHVELQEI